MNTDLLVLLILTIFLLMVDGLLLYVYIRKELKSRRQYYDRLK